MTAEEKRERLLKRILPALVITVIYFVFVSGFVSEGAKTARNSYENVARQGVSVDDLPEIQRNQAKYMAQVAKLKKRHQEFRKKMQGIAGYLTVNSPSNESTAILSRILARNRLLIAEEKRVTFDSKKLSPSMQEVKHWLKDTEDKEDSGIVVQQLIVVGAYTDMYRALDEIAGGTLDAVPVLLTMEEHVDEQNNPTGQLKWELVLWM